jgi:hypothetical protein
MSVLLSKVSFFVGEILVLPQTSIIRKIGEDRFNSNYKNQNNRNQIWIPRSLLHHLWYFLAWLCFCLEFLEQGHISFSFVYHSTKIEFASK